MKKHDDNFLRDYFENHEHRMMYKWMHYFEIYDRHFRDFRGKAMSLLEFGVYHGGSLQMWKAYFGLHAQIHGVDISPRCLELAEDRINIILGNQEDRNSLRSICRKLPKFDIIIDDGGHTMLQQRTTFEEMWDHLKDGGIYLCEDLHTSYWGNCGGGYRNPASFIEYTKNLIDQLNAWHSQDDQLVVNNFTRSMFAIHHYGSIVVFEKRAMLPPGDLMRGAPSFPLNPGEQAIYDSKS